MSGIKISALPTVTNSALTDIIPAVQGGVTSQESLQQVVNLFNSNIVLTGPNQVTGLVADLASKLDLSGGTMTGELILSGDGVNPLDAVTVQQLNAVSGGFTVVLACAAATTANLNATYANGAAGVGATLTNAGAMAAFAVDGYSANVNDRILVKNQTTTADNGIYTVTTVGSGAVNWVLTRSTDYDQAPSEIFPGTLVLVNNGTANANTSWLETATVTTIGTDPILFSQFTASPGTFLVKANNLSDVASAATSRTNLGLGNAAVKGVSDNSKANVSSLATGAGTYTIGHIATFSDINGTIQDGGAGGGFLIAANNLSDLANIATALNNLGLGTPTGTGNVVLNNTPTITTPNIVGTNTNNNAASGSVGEFVSSIISSGSSVSLSNNVSQNLTTISLTAGDWDVWGNVSFTISGTTGRVIGWSSSTSATLPDPSLYNQTGDSSTTQLNHAGIQIPTRRYSLAGTTTIYLTVQAAILSGTCTSCGAIYARRMR